MKLPKYCNLLIISCLTIFAVLFSTTIPAYSQARHQETGDDPSAPAGPVKLIFLHHSTGGLWLSDTYGTLGLELMKANYFVSDTNYSWGPNGIGSYTDIGNWYDWFRGPSSSTYLAAVLSESGQHNTYGNYSRLAEDPGGENEVILFKSCYPNSALKGSPNDPIPAIENNPLRGKDSSSPYHTISNAKGIYLDLLNTFAAHPNKLFVVITAPPLSDGTYASNARAFNNWLMDHSNGWLRNYPLNNVAVFDFYNVLTTNGGNPGTSDLGLETGNHHRWWNGAVQEKTDGGLNVLAYPSSDDHPSAAGEMKASQEFVPLLNVFYHRWKNGTAPTLPAPTDTPTGTATPAPPTSTSTDTATAVPPTSTSTYTATAVPPTSTPTYTTTAVPPTSTSTYTATPIPPTRTATYTATPVPPTSTSTYTATPIPPTSTSIFTVTPNPPTNTSTFTATAIPPTRTFTPSPSATRTPLSSTTPTKIAGSRLNSGFLPPSSSAAVTSSAGDNNGYEVNPDAAYADDGSFAADINSGTGMSLSSAGNSKDKHLYYDFNFDLPDRVAIQGIEVRLDARADSSNSSTKIYAQLSWDGGRTWTSAQATKTLGVAETTYSLGSKNNKWGRTWLPANFDNANFRVRLINFSNNTARDFYLDYIAVNVTYQ